MRVEVVESIETLRSIRSDWTELVTRARRATSFQRPEWVLPWADLFLEGELRTIAVRDGARLAGLAPLYVWRANDGTRELRFLGSGNTDYQDALIDPDAADTTLSTIAEAISGIPDWEVARFEEMPSGAEFLRLPVPPGCEEVNVVCQHPCPVVPLPADPQTLYARLAPGFTRRVRQALRRADREGMQMVTAGQPEVEQHVESLIQLHARRWHERDQAGVLATDRACTFLRRVAIEFAAAGRLVLRVLRNAHAVVAAMCGFRDVRRVEYYVGGFDPAFRHVSPGTVLIAQCIEQAIANGVEEFDFLRGGEPYKYDWGALDRFNYARIIRRRGLRTNV